MTMHHELNELLDVVSGGMKLALCSVVATKGSSPQKAGALMLVYADGHQTGTLGGGCVEAEVKQEALKILASNQMEGPTFRSFTLDDDYGWDDGLICGGRMDMLIEPLEDKSILSYFRYLLDYLEKGEGCTEAIVTDSDNFLHVPVAGSRLLFDRQGNLIASYPEGLSIESGTEGLSVVKNRRPWAKQGIAYLPILPRCRLLIVGGGHVGLAVAELANQADFDIWIVDDRKMYANADRFPMAQRVVTGSIDEALGSIEITSNTFCLIVTRGHAHDEEALFHLADRGARYVGMIGSKRKVRLIFDDLLAAGINADALDKVHAPVGINIGSQTVAEIAVSIVSELIAYRNCEVLPDFLQNQS